MLASLPGAVTKDDGFPIRSPRQLARQLNGEGELTAEMVHALAIELAGRFPSA